MLWILKEKAKIASLLLRNLTLKSTICVKQEVTNLDWYVIVPPTGTIQNVGTGAWDIWSGKQESKGQVCKYITNCFVYNQDKVVMLKGQSVTKASSFYVHIRSLNSNFTMIFQFVSVSYGWTEYWKCFIYWLLWYKYYKIWSINHTMCSFAKIKKFLQLCFRISWFLWLFVDKSLQIIKKSGLHTVFFFK